MLNEERLTSCVNSSFFSPLYFYIFQYLHLQQGITCVPFEPASTATSWFSSMILPDHNINGHRRFIPRKEGKVKSKQKHAATSQPVREELNQHSTSTELNTTDLKQIRLKYLHIYIERKILSKHPI